MSEHEEHHDHDHEGHDHHDHEGHDHDHEGHEHHDHHDHGHDHALIVERLPAGTWHVDHDSSEVNFRAKGLFGLIPVNGYFESFGGELQVDEQGKAEGRLVVDPATINTGIAKRDEHLKSSDFFHVGEHAQVIFTVAAIEPGGDDHLKLSGTLAVRDKTIPLSFPVYAIAHGDHLHIEGRVHVNHHAAGLGWAKPGMVGRSVRADVALTLVSGAA